MIDGTYFKGVLIFDPPEAKCDPISVYGEWTAKNKVMPNGKVKKVWCQPEGWPYDFGINDEICIRGVE